MTELALADLATIRGGADKDKIHPDPPGQPVFCSLAGPISDPCWSIDPIAHKAVRVAPRIIAPRYQ